MTNFSRRQIMQACGAMTLGLTAGCLSGGSGSDSEPESTPAQTTEDDDSDDENGGGGLFDQQIKDVAYVPSGSADVGILVGQEDGPHIEPDELDVDAGTEVQWRFETGGHTIEVTSQPDGANWAGVSERQGSGDTHNHTFEVAGDYEYQCGEHPDNTATLTVN